VQLKGAQRTLLITLYSKALDARSEHPILGDRKADEIVRTIDFDFESLRRPLDGKVIVARAKQIDEWAKEFLRENPDCVVLNLGCGLDSRAFRIEPPPSVRWFDLDFPQVIDERRNFYSERAGYQMLGSSVTDPGWLEHVPRDKPVMVVAEGLLEYLTDEEVKALLDTVTRSFPRGQVAFDVMSSSAIESGRVLLKERTGAEHKWAVDDVRAVDRLDLQLRRISNVSLFTSRYMPLRHRLTFLLLGVNPRFRGLMRLLRYEFGKA